MLFFEVDFDKFDKFSWLHGDFSVRFVLIDSAD